MVIVVVLKLACGVVLDCLSSTWTTILQFDSF